MIYDSSNAVGAHVYEVETLRKIGQVLAVDTTNMLLVCAEFPMRLNVMNELAVFVECYRVIHVIKAGSDRPVLFHCYGGLNDGQS